MRNTLKASMTAIMLSSVALVPAATIATVATTDAAFAKSDNAGGNGNGKSGEAQEKTRGKSSSSSGSNSATNRGYSTKLDRLLNRLTGQDKRSTSSASASGKPAKGSGMHPSELGNMNGALNANINAVLAHIRNGNTNGPVGHLAALAVAADGVGDAEDILAQEEDYLALEQALADALADAGYIGETALGDYIADVEGGADPDGVLDAAIVDFEAAEADRPTDEEVNGAIDALMAQNDAEADILDYWNKNEDDPAVVTEEEQALLDKLYERLVGNEEAISDAIGEPEVGEEVADCEGLEDCPEDDEMAELAE